jgi:hypothetical protein
MNPATLPLQCWKLCQLVGAKSLDILELPEFGVVFLGRLGGKAQISDGDIGGGFFVLRLRYLLNIAIQSR